MRTVAEFIEEISLGELSSSTLVEMDSLSVMKSCRIPTAIKSLNNALKVLYTEFELSKSDLILKLRHDITRYYIDSDYAVSSDFDTNIKYIQDSKDFPYKDNLLLITEVHDTNGNELYLNDSMADLVGGLKITTPEYNCVQVDDNVLRSLKYLRVYYRAAHEKIPLTVEADSRIKIRIPPYLDIALDTLVASFIFNNMTGENYMGISKVLYATAMGQIESIKRSDFGAPVSTGINMKPILGEWI